MKYGNLSFAGVVVFVHNDFAVLYDDSHKSFKLQYKTFTIPEIGGESIEHLDCLARALELTLLIAGIQTDDIKKGLSRFRISSNLTEVKEKERLKAWKS